MFSDMAKVIFLEFHFDFVVRNLKDESFCVLGAIPQVQILRKFKLSRVVCRTVFRMHSVVKILRTVEKTRLLWSNFAKTTANSSLTTTSPLRGNAVLVRSGGFTL